jgi:hypothetical protein
LIEVPTSDRGVNVAQDEEAKAKVEDLRKRLNAVSRSRGWRRVLGVVVEGQRRPDRADQSRRARSAPAEDPRFAAGGRRHRAVAHAARLSAAQDRDANRDAREDVRAGARRHQQPVAEQKRQVELLKYLDQLREQATMTWRNDD